jgi:hypothetical protein
MFLKGTFMKQAARLIAALVFFCTSVFAGDNDAAKNAYCKYIAEQATAQRDLLRSPSAIAGPTQPSAGTPPQMIFGITGSLANYLKAPLTMRAAHAACDVYVAGTDAQHRIDFAAPKMERDALVHRLELVQQGSDQLEKMIDDEEKMVQARNVTRPALYYLQSARARLDMRRTSALTGLLPYVPVLSDLPLRVLVSNKVHADEANQQAITKLTKEGGWDLVLSGGGRQQLAQFSSTTTVSEFGGFGEVSLTYNFARHSANHHLDLSASAYLDFKNSQLDDVAQQSAVLKKQVTETLSFLRPQLTALLEHDSEIEKSLASIQGLDTNNALAFKNQLLSDQIVLRVDIGDIQFRLEWMESYLHDNF